MRTEVVHFYSYGARLEGLLRLPDGAQAGPLPIVVQGPGWMGLAESKLYERWHAGFCEAGYAVLAFNYRGFGGSEGEPGWVLPEQQIDDIRAALSYVETRPELDAERIALFGIGGLGAGNAIVVAGTDERVRAVAVQNAVAEGADWLRRMRREHEWVAFLGRVREDARRYARDGQGEMVDPTDELMVQTPERRALEDKRDVDPKIAPRFHLQSAASILRYRPIDVVDRIAPRALLIVAVEEDTVTPPDHALRLYQRAGEPKRLIHLRGTTAYRQYEQFFHVVMPEIVDWFDRYLPRGAVEIVEVREGQGFRRQLAENGRPVDARRQAPHPTTHARG